MSGPDRWYLLTSKGQRQGPAKFSALKKAAEQGRIRPDHQVWQEGDTERRRAGDVPGLFEPAAEAEEDLLSDDIGGSMIMAAAESEVEAASRANAERAERIAAEQASAQRRQAIAQRQAQQTSAQPRSSMGGRAVARGEVEYAGFWLRAVAMLIDGLLFAFLFAGLSVILAMARGGMDALTEGQGGSDAWMELLHTVLAWLYFAGQESSAEQATLGKRAVGIRVTDVDGGRISFARATGRYFAKILSILTLLVGYFMAAFTPRKQALHDMIAGTLVVKAS